MKQFILYSVFQSTRSELENVRSHSREKFFLNDLGIPFQECFGTYKNKAEYSLQVPREYVNIIKERAWNAKQECILIVNDENSALAVFYNGEVKKIGKFITLKGPTKNDYTIIKNKVYSVK